MQFEWNEVKNLSNQRKHGVSFDEAVNVFKDLHYVSIADRADDDGDQRRQTIGLVRGVVLLMAAHTIRDLEPDDELIRIISARKASPQERRQYEDENGSIYLS